MAVTREAFERQRASSRAIERRESRLVAAVAVGLGIVQFVFIKWADQHLTHDRVVAIAGPAFLGYAALVGTLILRMTRRVAAARVRCPQCGATLAGMAERVAAATGNCDSCGGQVIAELPSSARP